MAVQSGSSGLLQQPGGFEGLLLFLVETDALDLAVADRDVSGQAGRSRLGPGEVREVPLGRPIERFGREVDSKDAKAVLLHSRAELIEEPMQDDDR